MRTLCIRIVAFSLALGPFAVSFGCDILGLTPEVVWDGEYGKDCPPALVSGDGTMYTTGDHLTSDFGGLYSTLHAIDGSTHESVLIKEFDGGIGYPIATPDGHFLCINGYDLVCIDKTGSEVWRTTVGRQVYARDVCLSRTGTVYVAAENSGSGQLSGFDLADGEELFAISLDSLYSGMAIGRDETLYLAGQKLTAFSPGADTTFAEGVRWGVTLASHSDKIALGDDFIIVPAGIALSSYTMEGDLLWEKVDFVPSTGHEPAIASDNTVYISGGMSGEWGLFAIDGRSGDVKWLLPHVCSEAALAASINGPPTFHGGVRVLRRGSLRREGVLHRPDA